MNTPDERYKAAEEIIYDIIAPAVGDIIRLYAPPTATEEYEEYDDLYVKALNAMRDLARDMEDAR